MFTKKWIQTSTVVGSALLLSACASTYNNPEDPLEGYNRAMFAFNETLDKALIKPVAKGYDTVVPEPISWGISNFFSNLNEITVILNDLLQLKFKQAFQDTGRFVLNSTVGVAGLFDVAGHAGYAKNNEDFGQTLGHWGVGPGAYVVLPVLGPRTVRDSFGLVADIYTDPVVHVNEPATRNALIITRGIDTRAELLKAESVIQEAATDKYAFVRDAYLQRRQFLVYDGNPPDLDDYDIFDDSE